MCIGYPPMAQDSGATNNRIYIGIHVSCILLRFRPTTNFATVIWSLRVKFSRNHEYRGLQDTLIKVMVEIGGLRANFSPDVKCELVKSIYLANKTRSSPAGTAMGAHGQTSRRNVARLLFSLWKCLLFNSLLSKHLSLELTSI